MTVTAVAPEKTNEGTIAPQGTPAQAGLSPAPAVDPKQPVAATTPAAPSTTSEPAKPNEGLGGAPKVEGKEGEAKKSDQAPEKYADFKAPEGADALHPEVATAWSDVARGLNLPQEKAQNVLDVMLPIMQATAKAKYDAFVDDWAKQSAHHKEWGGDKYAETLAIAKPVYESTFDAETRATLHRFGLDRHPGVIAGFRKLGQRMSGDRFEGGSVGHPKKGGTAQALFSKSKMNP